MVKGNSNKLYPDVKEIIILLNNSNEKDLQKLLYNMNKDNIDNAKISKDKEDELNNYIKLHVSENKAELIKEIMIKYILKEKNN